MKWRGQRESSNVEIGGSGRGGGGGLKMGLGGIVLVVILGLVMGKNPMEMLGLVAQMESSAPPAANAPADPNAPVTEEQQFSKVVLASTEDVWGRIFAASNQQYPPPTMVLFSGSVQSACGGATSAVGPFYCPGDRKVYLDTGFFDEMTAKLGGGGDFAQAYVIAHEVGHHIQTLTGVSDQVNQVRAKGGNVEGDGGLLVRQELQADCYAGLWAHYAQKEKQWMEPGDLEEAIKTAQAIGDDTLQRQSRGTVMPDSFSHGSSEQRMRWFRQGFDSGDIAQCDTFKATSL
ncbi:MAG: neutral zinc metallopeptidase [Arenimonas sp.]|uniref:KPN_02809 family neutral zinc metallopeptidase n=1 Tax=Arenimonas sp. TaxID=1872635 RepID=UPI003BFBED42